MLYEILEVLANLVIFGMFGVAVFRAIKTFLIKNRTEKLLTTKELAVSKDGNLLTIKVDKNASYHTQKNNSVRPHGTCGPTSIAMALRYSGYAKQLDAIIPTKEQDEDFITNFIHKDKRVIDFWKNNPQSWIRSAYIGYQKFLAGNQTAQNTMFGNEIHDILEFATNTLMGQNVDKFHYQCHIEEILFNITQGGAAVLSGVFPYKNNTKIHHVVCLAGFTTKQLDADKVDSPEKIDISQIDSVIIDDPYGDYKKLYGSDNGDNVYMPWAEFISIMNDQSNSVSKRAHLITPSRLMTSKKAKSKPKV